MIVEQCEVESDGVFRFPLLTKTSTSFQQITGGSASLVISDILNPSVVTGTGTSMFSFNTYSQEGNIIDTNADFDSIGFAPPYSKFERF